MPVEEKTHSEVVAAIKVGGSVTRLLVVDPETEAFFKRCGVSPTSDHLTGESSVVGELSEIRDAACLFLFALSAKKLRRVPSRILPTSSCPVL